MFVAKNTSSLHATIYGKFKLYQLILKLNDMNRDLQFKNKTKFEIIFGSKNTSNQYKSHKSLIV